MSNQVYRKALSSNWFYLTLLFIVTLIVYWNSLGNGFVYDDTLLITDQAHILQNINNVFSSMISMVFQDKQVGAFYRPVLMLFHFIDYNLWNGAAFGFHLTNVLLHLINVVLFFYLILLLFKDKLLAFISGLVFSLHPVQSEAVAWISGRNDPLMLIFVLLTFFFLINYREEGGKKVFLFLMSLAFFLSLLTKESALLFPAAFLAYDYFIRKITIKDLFSLKELTPYICLAATVLAYLLLRICIFKEGAFAGTLSSSVSLSNLGVMPLVYNFYLKALIYPGGFAIIPFINTQLSLGLFILQCLPLLVLISLIIIARNKEPLISFGVSWGLIALLPVSGLIRMPVLAMEHRLYSAMFGFALVFGWLALRWLDWGQKTKIRALAVAVIVLIILCYSWATVERNQAFKNPLALWSVTVKHNPYTDQGRTNLGASYIDAGKFNLAEEELMRSLELNSQNPVAYYNLGYLYLLTNREAEAKEQLEKAAELDPRYIKAHYNLGMIAFNKHDYQQAIKKMEYIISLNPRFVLAYNTIGDAYYNMGQYARAHDYYERAQQLNPQDRHSAEMLMRLMIKKEK